MERRDFTPNYRRTFNVSLELKHQMAPYKTKVSNLIVLLICSLILTCLQNKSVAGDPSIELPAQRPLNKHPVSHGLQHGPQEMALDKESQQEEKLWIAQAYVLRTHWRSWALPHKTLLQQMLDAKSDNQKALMAVWNALPTQPGDGQKGGVTHADLNTRFCYSWNPIMRLPLNPIADPIMRADAEKTEVVFKDTLLRDYKLYHDVELSRSTNIGPYYVSFWATGRVTLTKFAEQHLTGKPSILPEPSQQIYPPYEFLKRRKME